MKEENPAFLSIIEFASHIRVHPNTVRKAIRTGRINAFKVGTGKKSSYRIPTSEIERLAIMEIDRRKNV